MVVAAIDQIHIMPGHMSNGTEGRADDHNFGRRVLRIARSLAFFFLLAFTVGWVLNRVANGLEGSPRPAGFVRGMIQGALMPMAMPNLLVGKDLTIYALNNTGVPYKLGYTAGTNTAGAVFFGAFFWRVRRWRRANLRA
jgi:hypothetical protein